MEEFITGYGLHFTVGLIGFAVLLIAIGTIWSLVQDPKGAVKSLIGLGVFAVIILAVYFIFASGDKTGIFALPKFSYITEGVMRMVETGIITTIFLIVAALVLWVGMEIMNFVK